MSARMLTTSTEQGPPWAAASRSAVQELTRLLWNPMFDYHVHKNPRVLFRSY
jgi:hypothetical protein